MSNTIVLVILISFGTSTWTHPLTHSSTKSTSTVSVTLYKRVPELLHTKFYKIFGNNSVLNRTKVFPGAIPISHYHFHVNHPRGTVEASSLISQGLSSLKQPNISNRMEKRQFSLENTASVSTFALAPKALNNAVIAFPDDNQYQKLSIRNYTLGSTIQKNYQQKPVDTSSIIFPEERQPWIQKQIPGSMKTIGIKLEESEEKATTVSYEYEDQKLADEFLAWVKAFGVGRKNESSVSDLVDSTGMDASEFSLVNTDSMGIKKCKPGQRLDQNGNCRRHFGGK